MFAADFILTAVCAVVSTGGSSHPTVTDFADFKKRKKTSLKVGALWEGGSGSLGSCC